MINITHPQEITKIYLVENCYGDPNKVYIGKTKNCRKSQHKNKFGKDIKYTYIDQICSLNRDDWEPLETFWIEQFTQWGFNIQNVRKKGGSGPEFHHQKTKNVLKRKLKKRKTPWLLGNNNALGSKKSEIAKRKIGKSQKGKILSNKTKKLISNKNKGKVFTKQHKVKIGKSNKGNIRNDLRKSIIQYDMNGNILKIWDKYQDLINSKIVSHYSLRKCLNNNKNSYKNHKFRYNNEKN